MGSKKTAMERWSDQSIIKAARKGDRDAFDVFCQRIMPVLQRSVTAMCRREGIPSSVAADIVQDTLLKVFSSNDELAAKFTVAYLIAIARNKGVDWLRANHRAKSAERRYAEDLSQEESAQDTASRIEEARIQKQLHAKYYQWLRPEEQDILDAFIVEDLKAAQIADRLGISADAAHKRYQRALTHLREIIQEHGSEFGCD